MGENKEKREEKKKTEINTNFTQIITLPSRDTRG